MQAKTDRYNSRMIRNVVPAFICERFANGDRSGRFHGVALFVDIPGFTAMTEELMGHGPHGAEVLAAIVRTIFDLLGKPVYEQGGFIATIAGDGFTALFPGEGEDVACRGLAAAHEMQRQMVVNARQTTPYGDFDARVKVGLALGEVGWGIVEAVDGSRACYYFRGETITDCAAAEQLANRGEIILNRKFRDRIRDWLVVEPAGGYFRLAAITRSLPAPQAIVPYDPDPRIMTRFFPGDLLGMSVSGEFRQTVSLFIGLPSLRAERQLRIFVQTIFTLQEHYGGLLNRLDFSDKGVHLVLFWGAPISHENDIERALNFVLALQAQTSIPLHAGITYRMAHTGFVGSALREDYTAYGRGVNLAARLMMAAPRSEVWMDESLARRARQRFEVEYEGHVALKGFEYEQPVYVLMERKDAPERFYKGELVGRQRELEQMEEFVKPLWKGKRAGAMVILGEAGIGKSRLMHAFQASEQFAQREVLWALCQADPILRQPLNPFRYWLRRYFAQSEGLAEVRNKRNFSRKLDGLINQLADRSLAQELDRSRSFLGALVDLRWPDSLYEQLDPQGRFENTFTALSTLFLAESKRQPVIIQLEDAQWLDADSLEFVKQQTSNDERQPIALILTARPDPGLAFCQDQTHCRQINLTQLLPEDMKQLATGILEAEPTPFLLALLVERAEGNPFFAEQILLHLREENLLIPVDSGALTMAEADPEALLLPVDVRTVLMARLDGLEQDLREVVQTAAVLGREFEVQLLLRMLARDGAIRKRIEAAEWARIWSGIGPSRYMFQHALLRDVAYHMQARSLRSKLHLSAAHAISDLHGQDLSAYYDQLAYHYEQAGAVAQALEYLEKAGERAKNAYQNGMAIDHYQRALNLMPEVAPGRLRLLLGLGEVYFWTGDYRGAKETLLAALDAARSGDDARNTADALYWLGRVALATGDYQLAQEHLEQSLALARSEKHRETMTRILYGLGGLHWSLGRFETSKSCLEESLTLARLLGNANAELYALNLLGSVALNQGELETAHEFLTQAHDRARQVGNLERACIALNNLGVLSGNRGDNPSAQRYYQQALAIAREIGDRQTTSLLLVNLAETLILGEDLDSARRYLREGLGLAHQTGVISNMLLAIHNAGWLQVRSGNVRRGLALLGLALYHPVADSKVKRNVDEKLAYLGLKRDDPAVAANLELGKDLDLNPETRDLLAELGQAAR